MNIQHFIAKEFLMVFIQAKYKISYEDLKEEFDGILDQLDSMSLLKIKNERRY